MKTIITELTELLDKGLPYLDNTESTLAYQETLEKYKELIQTGRMARKQYSLMSVDKAHLHKFSHFNSASK